jgi:hypothetical protein
MRLSTLLVGLLIATSAHSEIGTINELSGVATIKRGKETITVVKGATVEQNDKVETKNGKVKITFKDGTTVNVTEHSALIIDDFVYDPKSSSTGKLGLKAAVGTVRYASGAIAGKNPNAVKINTPTAAIAVRGTDFIMSVNEVGGSMVILMPNCEVDQTTDLKGKNCGSGKIEVESGPTKIALDKPFQATLVESLGVPPTPPIVVNLSNTPINNNLQITPPKTFSGANVIAAARAAAQATGDIKKESKKDDKDSDSEKEQVAQQSSEPTKKDKEEKTDTVITVEQANKEALVNQVASVTASNEDPNLKKLWKDKSETQQIGWLYDPLSQNNKNYTNVMLPMDTKVQVVVTQDMQTVGYNFGPNGKNTGQIVINQNFR